MRFKIETTQWLDAWLHQVRLSSAPALEAVNLICQFGGDRLTCLDPDRNQGVSGAAVCYLDDGIVVGVASFGLMAEYGRPEIVGVWADPVHDQARKIRCDTFQVALCHLQNEMMRLNHTGYVRFDPYFETDDQLMTDLPQDVRDYLEFHFRGANPASAQEG